MADHANNLASKIRSNLTNSMKALGVDILTGFGTILVKHNYCTKIKGNANKSSFSYRKNPVHDKIKTCRNSLF